jgi:hypothetical protein
MTVRLSQLGTLTLSLNVIHWVPPALPMLPKMVEGSSGLPAGRMGSWKWAVPAKRPLLLSARTAGLVSSSIDLSKMWSAYVSNMLRTKALETGIIWINNIIPVSIALLRTIKDLKIHSLSCLHTPDEKKRVYNNSAVPFFLLLLKTLALM